MDLPKKIYINVEYDMSEETARYYKQLKEELLAEMDDGKYVDAVNPAVLLLRLHQCVCGFLTRKPDDEEGADVMYRFGGERVKELQTIVEKSSGPIVIWARFIEDRNTITKALKEIDESYCIYAGSDSERAHAKEAFMKKKKRIFLSNQATGGVGLDGLQGDCATVIHWSSSFRARHRWQSEARTTRIGTKGTVKHFDLIARRSVDRKILANLKAKKDLASLNLDDIRRAILVEN